MTLKTHYNIVYILDLDVKVYLLDKSLLCVMTIKC